MRADVVAALLLFATTAGAQRGVVHGVRTSAQAGGSAAAITVTGTNPCGAVRIDYGDGSVVTHPITGVPATIEHAYERPGTYRVVAEGMGNCDGRAQTTARVERGIVPDGQDDGAVQGRFRGMDRNGDGVITRSEWRGNNQSFEQHDWNNDGVLSGDEIRSDDAARGARRGEVLDSAEYADWTETGFRRLDGNSDGRLSRAEWRYDVAPFRRADRNGDGWLSLSEFLGDSDDGGFGRAPDEMWREGDFDRIDLNRDGIISPDEWRGSRDRFVELDDNRDGVVTRPEYGAARRGDWTAAEVVVNAQERWTRTGIYVRRGDLVRFDGAGTIQLSSNGRDVADVRGARTGRSATNAPLPDAAAGSLIARVGDSAPFLVGGGSDVRMPRDGEILLGVNDDYLEDNHGGFRVRISLGR